MENVYEGHKEWVWDCCFSEDSYFLIHRMWTINLYFTSLLNKEYTAMLKEIEAAQNEVRRLEDLILERMLEHDELAARQKAAESRLSADKAAVAAERTTVEAETARLERELEETVSARVRVVADVSATVLSIYETVRERRGTAVVEIKGGYCSACHVRIRPQAANELRRNQMIFQCESCKRILYFPPQGPTPAGQADGVDF